MTGWVEFAGHVRPSEYAPEGKLIRVVICPICEDTGQLRDRRGKARRCGCARHWMREWADR